jgi:hypothetical protein
MRAALQAFRAPRTGSARSRPREPRTQVRPWRSWKRSSAGRGAALRKALPKPSFVMGLPSLPAMKARSPQGPTAKVEARPCGRI